MGRLLAGFILEMRGGTSNDHRDQRHGPRHPDGEPVRRRPRLLSQAAAPIRHEAGIRRRQNSFTASAAGRRSASNLATRRWLPSASSSSASACTTSACEPVRARTWIGARACSRRWLRRSYVGRRKAAGRRAITTCCSRIRTASGWRCALSRAPVCWRLARRSIPPRAISEARPAAHCCRHVNHRFGAGPSRENLAAG